MAIINKIISGKYFAVLAITIFVTTGTINAAELEEIIVTAQKRAESLQDVPISVTTLAGVKMQQAGINKIEDLQQFVPNLQMTETGISTQVYIRGIGTGNSQGFEQSVGQYIDGIYYGRQQLIRAPFLDLERVEVLRGPQSILFGKNSIAGALNMTSAKPTEELSGYIQLNYESEYSTREALVAVSGPLTDTVKGRLAIRSYDTDGYVENTFLNSDEPERDDLAIRGILQWDVTDDLDMTLKLERDTFDTTGRQIEIIRDDPALAGSPIPGANYNVILGLLGHPGAITESKLDFERQAGGFGVKESSDNELENLTLTVNYNLGKNTLTSVTGFVSYEFLELCDCDYVAAPVFSVVLDEEYDQFSQEFRLTSPGGENIDWVAGVFFQTSDLDFDDRIVIPSNSVLGLVSGGALAPIRSTQVERDFSSDSDLWAVFGQLTWNIQDNLRLTLGARFTSEEKDGSRKVSVIDTATGTPSNPLLGAPTIYEAVFLIINEQRSGHMVAKDRDESSFTPLINLQWDVNENMMVYASYTTGFKSGGYDPRANNPASFEFEEEEASAFELGLKTTFWEGAAELNIALYHTNYEDLQISQFDGAFGFNVNNAAEVTIEGIEVDGRIAFTDNFNIRYALGFLDHEFDKYTGGNCYNRQVPDGDFGPAGNQLCDYSGKSGQYTPEVTGSISFNYHQPISDTLNIAATLDLNYTDEQNVHGSLDPLSEIDAYTQVNLRVALETESWELAILGRNLSDEEILTYVDNVPLSAGTFKTNTFYGFTLPPRTVTFQAAYRF